MRRRVGFEVKRQVAIDDIVEALEAGGAERVRVDERDGDCGECVLRYFFIEFVDARAGGRERVASGFHGYASSDVPDSPDGWTRLNLGADDRAYELMEGLGETFGGLLVDERTMTTRRFAAPEPAAPRMAA